MDFDCGTKFLVVDSFDDGKDNHLAITRGDVLRYIKPVVLEQNYAEGPVVLENLWAEFENSEGQVGQVMLRMTEPRFSTEKELNSRVELLKEKIEFLLQDPLNHATGLRDVATSHPRAAELLYSMGGVKALLKPVATHPSDGTENPPFRYLSDMIAALAFCCKCPIGDVGEKSCALVVKQKGMISKLSQLVESLYTGTKDGKTISPTGAPAAELLAAIGRSPLHAHTIFKKKVLQPCLKLIMDQNCALYKNKTFVGKFLPTILNYICALATHKAGKKLLLQNGAVEILESMRESSHTRGPYMLSKTALLFLKNTTVKKQQKRASQIDKGGHIMISYNWSTQELALRLATFLKDQKYKVWIDVEKMRGNVVERMAQAVEQSAAALVLYSQKYATSTNCLMEAEYISLLKKQFIPIITEPEALEIKGMLGIMRGQKMYVDFSSLQLGRKSLVPEQYVQEKGRDLVFLLGNNGIDQNGVGKLEIIEQVEEKSNTDENTNQTNQVITVAKRLEICELEHEKFKSENEKLTKRLKVVEQENKQLFDRIEKLENIIQNLNIT